MGDAPVIGIWNGAPFVHFGSHAVDDGRVVLLLVSRDVATNLQFNLFVFGFALFGLGDGGEKFGPAACLYDLVGGLTRCIQLPMLAWVVVGRVEDGFFKE